MTRPARRSVPISWSEGHRHTAVHSPRQGLRHPDPGGECWRSDPQTVAATVETYADLAGVPATTHHLRHLRARVLLHADLPLEALQDVLGQASPDTTKRIYAPLSHQKLRQLVQAAAVPAVEVARRAAALEEG